MKKIILITILIVSCGKKEPDNIEQKRISVTDSVERTCYYTVNSLDYCVLTIDGDQYIY